MNNKQISLISFLFSIGIILVSMLNVFLGFMLLPLNLMLLLYLTFVTFSILFHNPYIIISSINSLMECVEMQEINKKELIEEFNSYVDNTLDLWLDPLSKVTDVKKIKEDLKEMLKV